jgi:hypothetical protein
VGGGRCASGGCAFPDTGCPGSFLRYDRSASPSQAGRCVTDGTPIDGGGRDTGPFMNACGGDTVLDGDPETPCGMCGTGTWACDGPFSVVCVGELTITENITSMGLPDASTCYGAGADCSSASFEFRPINSMDGDPGTSWFSDGPKADSTPTRYDWLGGVEPRCITSVAIIGNGAHDNPAFQNNYGFDVVNMQLLDADNVIVWSMRYNLPGTPDPDIIANPGEMANTVRLLFEGHEHADCGGFSEIRVSALTR